jgi:hypothetical protein
MSHQALEEELLFPEIDRLGGTTGSMQANIEQQRACKPALTALQEYTRSTAPGDYDADVLLRLLNDLRAPLQTHLTAEISTFLELERDYDSAALLHMCRTVEKAASVRPTFLYEILTLVLGLSDRTCEGGIHDFSTVPWFLTYVMHYWFARRHAGAWRSYPSDKRSRPRALLFHGRE